MLVLHNLAGAEYALCDVAEIFDLWFETPVPFVFGQKLMLVEEPKIVSVHA